VSSSHESVPLVPGPPGVWRAADVVSEIQPMQLHCIAARRSGVRVEIEFGAF